MVDVRVLASAQRAKLVSARWLTLGLLAAAMSRPRIRTLKPDPLADADDLKKVA
jgi:hypothetical protein